jgi:HD-like signal output (HDOD) protein
MASISNKKGGYYRHPAFKGLSDKELISIYKIGSINKIDPGEVLVKEGDTDKTISFILGGSVKIINNLSNQGKEIAVLRQGDCLGEIAFIKQKRKTMSALATEPVTVLVLDEQGMYALAPKTQLLIYQNLYDLAKRRINRFIMKDAELADKNDYLTARVRTFIHAKKDEYEGSEIIQNILKSIPRLPMYATKLAFMLRDEDVLTSDVVKFANLDPSLVGIVMKTINSPYYNLQNKVTDFQHAVLLLGFSQVYQLVITDGVRSVMPATRGFRELQFHSAVVSFLCFEISQLCGKKQAPMLSTIGLLHDIGKSVILLLKKQYPKMALLIDMMDHATIGALLLKKWDLPDVICQSIRYQHYPDFLPPAEIQEEHQKDVAVLYIAHLCYEYLKGRDEAELPVAFLREYMDILKFSEGSFAEFVRKKILPVINKKKNSLPEDVRQFFKKGETQLIAHRFEGGMWGGS